ncbi:hypothetical protein [Agathobaculum sp. Marseille-P7918]|uniref:hypothetical protein n=1 Tax=Agathobaculum sp. Marseille-P7918 TaxID=2479843 RepID=UPI0035618D45
MEKAASVYVTVPAAEQLSAYQIAARANGYQFAALFPDAGQMPVNSPRLQNAWARLINGRMSAKPPRTRITGKPQPGSCGRPCLALVDQTGERHRLCDLGCPLQNYRPYS